MERILMELLTHKLLTLLKNLDLLLIIQNIKFSYRERDLT